MKIDFKEVLRPTIVLVLVCLIVTSLLGVTDSVTREPIKQNQIQAETLARQTVMPLATSFEQIDDTTYKALDGDNEVVGYILTTQSKAGYGGLINVMTGIDTNRAVTGVSVLSHSETVGLGANATNESFHSQYKQDMSNTDSFAVTKGEANDGEIQALTGATITSSAVTEAVNIALQNFDQLSK